MIERFRRMQGGGFTPVGPIPASPQWSTSSTTLTTTQNPMFKIPEQNRYNAETALKDYAINPIEEYGEGLWRNKQKDKVDPYFLLRGFKTGASWLSEMIERRRQDEYMNRQMSTLGQLDALPVGDFQPVNNNLYFERGGIKIDPRNRGKFTAAAKQRGLSVQQFARQVLGNPERYTPLMRQRANFARNARKWNKEEGGTMQQGGKATTADSLALYNNSMKVLDYYRKRNYTEEKPTYMAPYKFRIENLDNIFNSFNKYSSLVTVPSNKGNKLQIPSKELSHLYRKNVDSNKFFQREYANAILDTRSPMQLYDRRIYPTASYVFTNRIEGDPLKWDAVGIDGYDPIAVKPWNMLTPQERELRIKRYGKDANPSGDISTPKSNNVTRKPTQTIKRDYYLEPPRKKSKVATAAPVQQTPVTGRKDFFIDERPSSEQEILRQMERPQGQPQGQSVFSPSGHLIGVMQGRNFVPLPNEAMREGDRTLLNDKQQLNKYLQSKYGKYALPVMMKGGKYRGKKK